MPKQQTDASQINHFQEDTQQKLRSLLAAKGHPAKFETVEYAYKPFDTSKEREFGVRVTVDRYETWIHPDGADVIGGKIDKRFEICDYSSLEELQAAYLKVIGNLLS